MNNFKLHLTAIFIAVISITLFSCSKDSDKDDKDTNNTSTFVKVDVSGEVNESFEGFMAFYPFEFLNQKTWQLSGNNFSPQTFTVHFKISDSNGAIPGPGTYKLEEQPFNADFEYIVDGDYANPWLYSLDANNGDTGTLTIESLDDKYMTGKFNFDAVRKEELTNLIIGQVNVTGTFKALKDE